MNKGNTVMKTTDGQVQSLDHTVAEFEQLVIENLYHMHGQALQSATQHDAYMALAYTVRDFLIERWRKTNEAYFRANPKFVYYLSAEYLPGKQLSQNMLYTGTTELVRQALARHPVNMEEICELDAEPGLGNGGLGRLAACFLDSLATLGIPAVGYGIRYEFGIFEQAFENGQQIEKPDNWLKYGNPWEFPQSDEMVEVGFGGRSEHYRDAAGSLRMRWQPDHRVLGEPCTMLVPGFGNETVNILQAVASPCHRGIRFPVVRRRRLCAGRRAEDQVGEYQQSPVPERRDESRQVPAVAAAVFLRGLFAAGHHPPVPAAERRLGPLSRSGRDPVERHASGGCHCRVDADSDGRAPAGLGPGLGHRQRTFSTPATRCCPRLERWPVELFGSVLPRHLEIVYEINRRFLDEVRRVFRATKPGWPGCR
jgi:glycogen phosphorylase